MSDNDPQPSPGPHDDSAGPNASGLAAGNGGVPNSNPNAAGVDPSRGVKRTRPNQDDDDDDEDNKPGRERRKIEIKFIQDKSRRHITFSKRKAGIMKKVHSAIVLCFSYLIAFDLFFFLNRGSRCLRVTNSYFQHPFANLLLMYPGLRTFRIDRHSGSVACCLRDRSSLYLHNTQASAIGHQSGRKESHPGSFDNFNSCFHFEN